MSMQGVGVKTAASVLLAISDAGTFRTAGHLTAYDGIAPSRGVPGRPSEGNSLPGPATNNSRTHFSNPSGSPPAMPRFQGLLEPKTSRREEPQRRRRLSGSPPLRCHPLGAPKRDTLRGISSPCHLTQSIGTPP
jgi:transposase